MYLLLFFHRSGTVHTREKQRRQAESVCSLPSVLLPFEADRLHSASAIKTDSTHDGDLRETLQMPAVNYVASCSGCRADTLV